jgi:hypothetical protein
MHRHLHQPAGNLLAVWVAPPGDILSARPNEAVVVIRHDILLVKDMCSRIDLHIPERIPSGFLLHDLFGMIFHELSHEYFEIRNVCLVHFGASLLMGDETRVQKELHMAASYT